MNKAKSWEIIQTYLLNCIYTHVLKSKQSQRLFIQEELTFKSIEQQKIIVEMRRIKSDLRMVINLITWIHISRMFLESNIKTTKSVEGIQNYKHSELKGKKLQHDPKKVIHNFSSYQLSDTEKVWIFHYHQDALNSKTIYYHLNCYTEMFMIVIIKMSPFWTLKVK